MTILVLDKAPAVVAITVTDEKLTVDLADGRSIVVPLEWYPRLVHGSPKERHNWRLLGNGYAIEWPDLDEHIGVEGLLAGRRSGESKKSFKRWLASRSRVKALVKESGDGSRREEPPNAYEAPGCQGQKTPLTKRSSPLKRRRSRG